MSDILKTSEIQRLCGIYYQFNRNIVSITNDPDRFHQKVVFTGGQTWLKIETQKTKINYSEPPEQNSNGILYRRKLEVIFPSEKDADIELFENLSNVELILKLEYSNGAAKLFGNLQQPVICQVGYNSGQDTEYTPVFSSPSPYRSPWISS